MAIDSTEDSDQIRPQSRREIKSEIEVRREKIRADLRALREEVKIAWVPQVVREYPLQTIIGGGVLGFIVGRMLFGRSNESGGAGVNHQLLDDLLETIIDDAAHRVAAGSDTQRALRETLREHTPIVFEVDRAAQGEPPGIAVSLLHTAFNLTEPYLRSYVTGWIEERLAPPEE